MLDAQQNRSERPYIFSEKQTRLMFIISAVLMVGTLVGILILTTSRPQGTFVQLDRTQHRQTLERAVSSITEFRDNGDGTFSIPIDLAMALIAERGVENPFTVQPSE